MAEPTDIWSLLQSPDPATDHIAETMYANGFPRLNAQAPPLVRQRHANGQLRYRELDSGRFASRSDVDSMMGARPAPTPPSMGPLPPTAARRVAEVLEPLLGRHVAGQVGAVVPFTPAEPAYAAGNALAEGRPGEAAGYGAAAALPYWLPWMFRGLLPLERSPYAAYALGRTMGPDAPLPPVGAPRLPPPSGVPASTVPATTGAEVNRLLAQVPPVGRPPARSMAHDVPTTLAGMPEQRAAADWYLLHGGRPAPQPWGETAPMIDEFIRRALYERRSVLGRD
jgi:hypothetical protein